MELLWQKLLSMSTAAGWVILVVIILRLVLYRAPRWLHCILWALVGVRLVVPMSLKSPFSLVPQSPAIAPAVLSEYIVNLDAQALQFTGEGGAAQAAVSTVNAASSTIGGLMSWIWLAGVLFVLGYALVSMLCLRRRVAEAVLVEGKVWQCDRVYSPFILGVIRPKIYLPSNLPPEAQEPVLAHEFSHLARRDHWWKPLGFVLLAIYWFHPLVWVAYVLFCRDLELACDERVVRKLDQEGRKKYSLALLTCSTARYIPAACPLAFGEGGVKRRVKAALNYKKPAFWLVLVAGVACVVAAVCFLTDPVSFQQDTGIAWAKNLTAEQVVSADLVVMPSQEDRQYKRFAESEIPALVEFINQSRGTRVTDAENMAGQSIWFYFTMADGTRHEVGNIGNVYLVIDREYYDAPYNWLSTWSQTYGEGNSPLPENYFSRVLTVDDVLALSEKGESLTWADLEGYTSVEVGSGLYIRVYPVSGRYTLWVSSAGGPDTELMYATLNAYGMPGEAVEIRTGDVMGFFSREEAKYQKTAERFAAITASPAASSSPKDYLEAHPEEHQALLDDKTDTLRYIFSHFLVGGQTGLEGHIMRIVMDELAPESQLKLAADTGQEYFDAWKESAEDIVRQRGNDWMEENQPAAWMMLQMRQAVP